MGSLTAQERLDRQRMALALGLVCAFVACVLLLFFRKVPDTNSDLITYMIGQLSGMATMALGYYFVNKAGADAKDMETTQNTGRALDAIRAAAHASAGSDAPGPEEAAETVAEAATRRAEDFKET